MFRSIRWKLTLSYVALALLTATIFGFLFLYLIKNSGVRQEKEYLAFTGRSIAQQIEQILVDKIDPATMQTMLDTIGFLNDVRIKVLDSRKELILTSRGDLKRNLQLSPNFQLSIIPQRNDSTAMPERLNGMFSLGTRMHEFTLSRRIHGLAGQQFIFKMTEGNEVNYLEPDSSERFSPSPRVITVQIGNGNEPLGFVELSQGPDFGKRAVETARNAIILAALGAVVVAILAGLLMGRKLTRPIIQLTGTVQSMSLDDMSVRAPEYGKDEIGQLASQFNQMADRLEQSFRKITQERDTLKRFIEDASHELRTPVTALKTFNELLLGKVKKDVHTQNEFLLESRSQLDRLDWTIENLLCLSRLDAGLSSLTVSDHCVGAIIDSVVAAVSIKAEQKDIKIFKAGIDSDRKILCDRQRMEMALENLLDNGIKYSSKGRKIEIGWREEGALSIWVKDEGEGIDAEDLPHIFERFYRSRSSPEEGSGLGLSIVESIVLAHGGTVDVQSRKGEGSIFSLKFPQKNTPS